MQKVTIYGARFGEPLTVHADSIIGAVFPIKYVTPSDEGGGSV